MITFILLAGLSLTANLETQSLNQAQCLQLDCSDAIGISKSAEAALVRVTENLQRMRELAIQASNGAIGNKERGFLDDELQAHLEDTFQIVKFANFVDIFGSQHFYFQNGLEFKTPIKVPNSNFAYLQDFNIPAIDQVNFGAYAQQSYKLKNPEANYIGYQLSVNDLTIIPSNATDSLSGNAASLSAITLAAAINSRRGETGVRAQVEETVIDLYDFDDEKLNDLGALQANDFLINGVDIVGYAFDTWSLIQTINDFRSSTGIKARLVSGSVNDLELYAADGRNISIELSQSLTETLPFPDYQSGLKVYNGSVSLSSHKDFTIELLNGFPILEQFENGLSGPYAKLVTTTDPDTRLYSIDISTQSNAEESRLSINKALSETNQLRVDAWLPQIYCR